MKTTIHIDRYSHRWVHKDFNLNYISSLDKERVIYIGHVDSDAYKIVGCEKHPSVDPTFKLVNFVRRLGESNSSREVVFLVLTKNDVLPAIVLKLSGYDVSYIYHKLTLRCRLTRWHWKVLFQILDSLAIYPLCLEEPHPVFKRYKLTRVDQFRNVTQRALTTPSQIHRKIAFIGRPDDGKNFPKLEMICSRLKYEIVIFSDDQLDTRHERRPHTNIIDDCDFVWGFYDADHYTGIQSGLPYVALSSGLKLVTNRNIGFGDFSKEHPDYCLPFHDALEVEQFLRRFSIGRDNPAEMR